MINDMHHRPRADQQHNPQRYVGVMRLEESGEPSEGKETEQEDRSKYQSNDAKVLPKGPHQDSDE